jgi:hypothetical protein
MFVLHRSPDNVETVSILYEVKTTWFSNLSKVESHNLSHFSIYGE